MSLIALSRSNRHAAKFGHIAENLAWNKPSNDLRCICLPCVTSIVLMHVCTPGTKWFWMMATEFWHGLTSLYLWSQMAPVLKHPQGHTVLVICTMAKSCCMFVRMGMSTVLHRQWHVMLLDQRLLCLRLVCPNTRCQVPPYGHA